MPQVVRSRSPSIRAAVPSRSPPGLRVLLKRVPLVLAGKMYAELVEWCRTYMLREDCPLASTRDMTIPICVEDGPAILRLIREHHGEWKTRNT